MTQPRAADLPVPESEDADLQLGDDAEEEHDEQAEYEQFRRWMQIRERERHGRRRGRDSREPSRRRDDDDDEFGNDSRANAGPPPPWDGTESPFEDYLIRARIWVNTTKARAKARGPLLLKALSGTPFQDFKYLAKDLSWLADPDNAEILLSKMDSPEYYGDDQDEHLLASLARITYHLKRQKSESARQFLGRWEAAERKVHEHKVNLPAIYKGFLLINALGLPEGDIKALLNFTQGSIEPKDVKNWLRKHEAKLQANQLGNDSMMKNPKTPSSAVHLVEDPDDAGLDLLDEIDDTEDLDTMETMLADLLDADPPEPGTFEESEAAEILAMMIKEKKKSYVQSAQLKKDRELGRGYRGGASGGPSRAAQGPIRPGTYRLSIAELKQRTRCQKCGQLGHWKRECPNKPSGAGSSNQKETHLLEVELDDYEDAMFCHMLERIPVDGGTASQGSGTEPVLNEENEPKGYGHDLSIPLYIGPTGALRIPLNQFNPEMLQALTQAEQKIQKSSCNEFEVLSLSELAASIMDCSSPTNKRARPEGADQDRTGRAVSAWQRFLLKIIVMFRPAVQFMVNVVQGSLDRSFNHVKENVAEFQVTHLEELKKAVDAAIKDKTESDRMMFVRFQNWKKERAYSSKGLAPPAPPTETEKEFEMVEEESSLLTMHCSEVGSRGRRLSRPRTDSAPRGPPPPEPVKYSKKSSFAPSETSSAFSMSTTKQPVPTTPMPPSYSPEGVITDKMKQQEVFTASAHLFNNRLVVCRCHPDRMCKMELSQTPVNYKRLFFNCSEKNEERQCGFFQWCENQPMLEDGYKETRERIRRSYPRDLTPREMLVMMCQDLCGHHATTRAGSNGFVTRVRCRTCQKLISYETKSMIPVSTAEPAAGSSIPEESESSLQADYQEFLKWQINCLSTGRHGLGHTKAEADMFWKSEEFGVDMSVLNVGNCANMFLNQLWHAIDLKAACTMIVLPNVSVFSELLCQVLLQGIQKLSHGHSKLVVVSEVGAGLAMLDQMTCLPHRSRHSGMAYATNWQGLHEVLQQAHDSTAAQAKNIVRHCLGSAYGIDRDRVHEHEISEQQVENQRQLANYQKHLHRPMEDHEIYYQHHKETNQNRDFNMISRKKGDNMYQFMQTIQSHDFDAIIRKKGVLQKPEGVKILRAAKASDDVIKVAQDLRCSVCERFLQTRPPRRAAPPRELGLNEVIGMDTVWLPAVGQKRKKIALNIIDYASHFQMVIPLRGRSPEAVWSGYRNWVKFFGPPKQIWADQGGEFKGTFRTRTAQEGTRMDPSSLESPFQRGLAERHGKTFKAMLEKVMQDYNCSSVSDWQELVDTTSMMKNRLASRGGFSPVQRVLGYLPRLPGGLLSGGQDDAEAGKEPILGDGGLQRAMTIRKLAAKAFFEVDCDQALRNVLAGGPRPQFDYAVGQMIYFYRLGHSKKGDRPHQRWHGPARVIMTDLPSTLWLSYQGNLVKASPERVRPGSEEEQLTISGWLDGLTQAKKEFEKEPKKGYIDLTKDPVPEYTDEIEESTEDLGDDDILPAGVHYRRLRAKMSPEQARRISFGPENMDETPPMIREGLRPEENSGVIAGRTNPAELEVPDDDMNEDNEDEEPAVEPPAKRSRIQLLEIYYAKLETLFKTRQRKEVRLKDLNARDLECFLKATTKEIHNNLETKAYEMLDSEESQRIRRDKPERIMESRYVRTAKPLEPGDVDKAQADGTLLSDEHGGPCKAKVRHVMKGFSEDGAEDLEAATPQVTREGVMFVTQVIASKGWRLGFLDFTQAFHSGDPIARELYAEQPPEGVPGMKKGDLLKLLKTCYGLLDGPMAWFRHLKRVLLEELGYTQSLADPCIYFLHDNERKGWDRLRGIVSVATDDLLHGGDDEHESRMQKLNERYKLGKFQYGAGRFTGKQFTPQDDGSIIIDQKHYVEEKVRKIPLTRTRKGQRYSYCSEEEIAQLRSLVGALSWLAKETRPDLCGRVSLLQQQFPRPRVRDIVTANQLAVEAEKFSVGIKVSPIALNKLRVSAVTDAAWGNSEDPAQKEETGLDFWVETPTQWIRKHVQPRRTLFHPGMVDSGPDIHQIEASRITRLRQDHKEDSRSDQWNTSKVGLIPGEPWTGETVFTKTTQGVSAADISETFLQNRRTCSQGGHIIIFHDQDLQFEPSAEVTVASWKSYRLKRKVVNTLSAECQALASGIGNVHWHRFLLLEAQGAEINDQDWERSLAGMKYLAVTDSKSLFDSLSKQTCPYSQIDDKRTAIDISIIKNELSQGGTIRWIDGRNMISDSLTKSASGCYLRHVMSKGRWTLNELGFQTLFPEATVTNDCLFLYDGLWDSWFQPK
ncbi:RE1 [Symbiodinium sp. CCMP2456]|nr:RE1 [Symbiodinium sp. CCMP2456]